MDNVGGRAKHSERLALMKGHTAVHKQLSRPRKLKGLLKPSASATHKMKARGLTPLRRVRGLGKRSRRPPMLEAHGGPQPHPRVVAWANAHFEANRELYQLLAKL